jgi:predicted RNA-binding protein with PIN domain
VIYLVDGSNLLGRLQLARESAEAKRELVQRIGSFCRLRHVRAICFFDGPAPESFGKNPTNVQVRFSGTTEADRQIIAAVERDPAMKCVVTSDRQLGARVQGRRVTIMDARLFGNELANLPAEPAEARSAGGEDWASYFSDPNNRNI